MSPKIRIAMADDHSLFRDGLAELVNGFDNCEVIIEASNGKELTRMIKKNNLPELVLLDISMPEMDGYTTTQWLKKNYPKIKIIAISMYDNESSIIKMIKLGVNGYVLKDIRKEELYNAIRSVMEKGFYYSDMITNKLVNSIHRPEDDENELTIFSNLTDRELEFLRLICTDLTYKDIADKMFLSPHTIDGYRDALFKKLNVKNRVGLAIYSIKNNIVTL